MQANPIHNSDSSMGGGQAGSDRASQVAEIRERFYKTYTTTSIQLNDDKITTVIRNVCELQSQALQVKTDPEKFEFIFEQTLQQLTNQIKYSVNSIRDSMTYFPDSFNDEVLMKELEEYVRKVQESRIKRLITAETNLTPPKQSSLVFLRNILGL